MFAGLLGLGDGRGVIDAIQGIDHGAARHSARRAVLTGVNKPFDGSAAATVKAKVAANDLVFGDTFDIPDLTGTFDNAS